MNVFVSSIDGEGRWQISLDEGGQPRFTEDGQQLLFASRDGIYIADLRIEDQAPSPTRPRRLRRDPRDDPGSSP